MRFKSKNFFVVEPHFVDFLLKNRAGKNDSVGISYCLRITTSYPAFQVLYSDAAVALKFCLEPAGQVLRVGRPI